MEAVRVIGNRYPSIFLTSNLQHTYPFGDNAILPRLLFQIHNGLAQNSFE